MSGMITVGKIAKPCACEQNNTVCKQSQYTIVRLAIVDSMRR